MLVDGPHFQATDEGELIFLVSDGDSSRRPTEHDIMEPEEEEGTLRQNYYLHVPLDDPDSHRWRAEIAKYLAPLVLGNRMGRLPWTLADFPQGYVLLLHKAPRRAQPSSHLPRRDFYLYGATDVPSFASPLEFVRHAEWLMRGAHRTLDLRRSPRCTCKYCDLSTTPATRKTTRGGPSSSSRSSSGSPYRKQSVISRELKRVRANVLARIGDGDEEDVEVADAIAEEGEDVDADANADGDADAAVNVDAAGAGTDAGVGTDADADVDAIATTTAAPATTDHDDDGN